MPSRFLLAIPAFALAACSTPGDDTIAMPVAGPVASVATAMTPSAAVSASANPLVGGAAMYPDRTIVENVALAPNLTTLVAAMKAADLIGTLSGPGPFTVFAPTDEAFGRLAPGTVNSLLEPDNKPALVKFLTYHVVAGAITAHELLARIAAGGGSTILTTMAGEPLTLALTGAVITVTDVGGNKSYIEVADVRQANGLVHVVNGVLVPRLD